MRAPRPCIIYEGKKLSRMGERGGNIESRPSELRSNRGNRRGGNRSGQFIRDAIEVKIVNEI